MYIGAVDFITCPSPNCLEIFNEEKVRKIITNNEFVKFKQLKLNNYLSRAN